MVFHDEHGPPTSCRMRQATNSTLRSAGVVAQPVDQQRHHATREAAYTLAYARVGISLMAAGAHGSKVILLPGLAMGATFSSGMPEHSIAYNAPYWLEPDERPGTLLGSHRYTLGGV